MEEGVAVDKKSDISPWRKREEVRVEAKSTLHTLRSLARGVRLRDRH